MENFASILERDYGFKSGKNAPMASSSAGGSSSGGGYGGLRKTVPASRMSANASTFGQEDPFGLGRKNEGSKSSRSSYGSREDIFSPAAYDDVFGGPPKSTESGARYDDVFGGASQGGPVFDDLLGGFGGSTPKVKSASGSFHSSPRRSDRNHFVASEPVYDELLPGFGFLPKSRASVETKATHEPDPFVPHGNDPLVSGSASGPSLFVDDVLLPGFESTKSRSSSGESSKVTREADPFVPLFDDPLSSSTPPPSTLFDDDGLLPGFSNESSKSRSFREAKVSPVQDSFASLGSEPVSSSIPSSSSPFDDPLNIFGEPQVPRTASSSRAPTNGVKVDRFDSFDSLSQSPATSSFFKDASRKASDDVGRTNSAEEAMPVGEGFQGDDISEASPDSDPLFPSQTEVGKSSAGPDKVGEEGSPWDLGSSDDQQLERGSSMRSRSKGFKEGWLTVDNLKLVTQPSVGPPPSRRPPPLPGSGSTSREKGDARDVEFVTSSSASTPEEDHTGGSTTPPSYEQAVPGWMDFKIQPARDEEREREEARAARDRRRQEREEAKAARESRDKEIKDREARHAREQERLRREKEREKDRAAVRIATLEARERAAQEAREKAERSAVERVTGEARDRAASQARARVERAAVDRANAEARERAEMRAAVERAALEARERAEKAAAEKAAVERAAAEVRERAAKAAAEKVAVERAQTEVRERAARAAAEKAAAERAAAEARERAEKNAAEKAARERSQQQRKSENDLETLFGGHSSSPATNDTRSRPSSMNNNVFGDQRRTSSGTATASMDDWGSIFGSTPGSDDTQENRAGDNGRSSRRIDRQENTRERARKAIAEINQRDLETQREQAEKQRAGDILDSEIKRWANGKEGNLRALLSTLQYVLWPECGWVPVSLTDLINPAAVKKTYRRATLYVHPDKVQQKGATVQQKYIAEKVFDLLKEASNKFNSEELF